MTYAVTRLLAHIERGVGRDDFGRSVMFGLCGARVYTGSHRDSPGNHVGLADPMFYRICGRCTRIQKGRDAKTAKDDPVKEEK